MIKSNILNKLSRFKHDFIFVLLFIIFASFYYDSVLSKGPLNAHMWRQTDCLSITRNYSQGVHFLQPEMDILLADNHSTGKTAGEFPILYYTVGIIWKYLGESYLTYRLFYLLILFAGIVAFYKSLKILFKAPFWAIVISALLFTSPVYASYGVSFLTDAPAFSFVLIGLYFLLQYHKKRSIKIFYLAMAFFALGGLIKISSLIAFLFLFIIFLWESIFCIQSLGNR